MAKKKIAELELSLLHLQQNVEIPEISLSIHPAVQRAIDEVLYSEIPSSVFVVSDCQKCRRFMLCCQTHLFFIHSVAKRDAVSRLMHLNRATFPTRPS